MAWAGEKAHGGGFGAVGGWDVMNGDHTKSFREKYRLRKAAGMYWLLDIGQPGIPYESPVPLNRTGALICEMLEGGAGAGEIAEALSASYGISVSEAREDLEQFAGELGICDYLHE